MYDQVVKCQRAGLCLSEHFLIYTSDYLAGFGPWSEGCQVSGFEADCPVFGRLVRLKISARTGHRYIHMYTDPDPQFLAAAWSLEVGQECPFF